MNFYLVTPLLVTRYCVTLFSNTHENMHKINLIFTLNQNFNDAKVTKVVSIEPPVIRGSLYLESLSTFRWVGGVNFHVEREKTRQVKNNLFASKFWLLLFL